MRGGVCEMGDSMWHVSNWLIRTSETWLLCLALHDKKSHEKSLSVSGT